MRLLARTLSLGRLCVEEWAAAPLVIADNVAGDLTQCSSDKLASACFSDLIEDPRPLSAYLEGRRLCRGRRTLFPLVLGSLESMESMIEPYVPDVLTV